LVICQDSNEEFGLIEEASSINYWVVFPQIWVINDWICVSMFLVNACHLSALIHLHLHVPYKNFLENIEGQLSVAFALLRDSRFWLDQSLLQLPILEEMGS